MSKKADEAEAAAEEVEEYDSHTQEQRREAKRVESCGEDAIRCHWKSISPTVLGCHVDLLRELRLSAEKSVPNQVLLNLTPAEHLKGQRGSKVQILQAVQAYAI